MTSLIPVSAVPFQLNYLANWELVSLISSLTHVNKYLHKLRFKTQIIFQ